MSSDALEIIRNSNAKWRISMVDYLGVPIPIQSSEITFIVKKNKEDTTPLFQRQNAAAGGGDDEIDFYTDGSDGIFDVFIVPSNTSGAEEGEYFYSAEVVVPAGDVYIKEPEIFNLKGDL